MKISYRFIYVWNRNLQVYLTTWYVNFLPPFLEPLLYLFAFGLGLGAFVKEINYEGMQLSYLNFITPAIIQIGVLFNSFFECTYGSFVRMYYQKTFDAMLATPLTIEEVILGELLWGATKGFLVSLIMLIPLIFFKLLNFPSVLMIPFIGFIAGLMFSSIAMCFTAISPSIDIFNLPIYIFITPMTFFSETFFPLNLMPNIIKIVAQFLPLTHPTRLLRFILINRYEDKLIFSTFYIFILTIILVPLSIYLMKKRLIK